MSREDPGVVVTNELFPDATREQVEKERQLRLKAFAVRSDIQEVPGGGGFKLVTQWNLFGEG